MINQAHQYIENAQKDLQEIDNELAPLETLIHNVERDADKLGAICKQIREKHLKHDQDDKNAELKMTTLKKKNIEYSQQLSDLKEIKSSLSDQKNKEIKKIEQKQFDLAMKFYKNYPNDTVASFLIQTIN